MNPRAVKVSKFLSLVLRHQPEKIGLQLDAAGWAAIDELLAASKAHGFAITQEELEAVVSSNDKQRFAFSEDRQHIRASQGHSLEIALGYEPMTPPDVLYHGTADRFLISIREQGLLKGRRHHVHLSADRDTALKVGQRHGKPIVLTVQAALMNYHGLMFYLSANGVWLTDHVPTAYLVFE